MPHTASQADVKTAYHRALLLFHPDKLKLKPPIYTTKTPTLNGTQYTVDEIQQAYTVLSDPLLRSLLDDQLKRSLTPSSEKGSQRPAEVISLEDFTPPDDDETSGSSGVYEYTYACRCGGLFKISYEQLEVDVHLVGCQGCSEVVWVGYEAVEE